MSGETPTRDATVGSPNDSEECVAAAGLPGDTSGPRKGIMSECAGLQRRLPSACALHFHAKGK